MVEIRWVNREDANPDVQAELMAVAAEAFLSSHGHMLSEEEKAWIRKGTTREDYRFNWEPLPPQVLVALAVDSQRRVGAIALHRHPRPGDYGVIEPMNIHPDYQRRGIGSRLWKFMAARSKELGDRGMQVWAR